MSARGDDTRASRVELIAMIHALFPETRRFPSTASRQDAWRRVWDLGGLKRYSSILRRTIVAFLQYSPLIAAAVAVWVYRTSTQALLVAFIVYAIVALGAMLIAFWTPVRRALRHELVLAGVSVCIPCGYDLQGTKSGTFPECGASVPDPRSLPVLVIEASIAVDVAPRADGPLPRLARPLGRSVGRRCYWLSRPFNR